MLLGIKHEAKGKQFATPWFLLLFYLKLFWLKRHVFIVDFLVSSFSALLSEDVS